MFDAKTDYARESSGMRACYAEAGVTGCDSLAHAIEPAGLILSLVTADQALAVAEAVAACIAPGSYFCDMNSVAPPTKQAAAAMIGAVGAHYIDVAVMARSIPRVLRHRC